MTKKYGPAILFLIVLLVSLLDSTVYAAKQNYKVTTVQYTVPDVTLVSQNSSRVPLRTVLASGRPVMFDFIFTTCTTICPVLSAGFTNFQRKMGTDANGAHLVSISIDPQNDTPRRMREYLRKFDAKTGWDFLTGSKADIDKVIAALDARAVNKMDHLPLVIIWSPARKTWTRIHGFISTAGLIEEYLKAVGK